MLHDNVARVSPLRGRVFGPHTPWNQRRVSRDREHSPYYILRAVPEGSMRVKRLLGWLDTLVNSPGYMGRRSDFRLSIVKVARELAAAANARTKTTRPTWARLQDRAGVSRVTVHRVLRWLRGAGYLGLVGTGRQRKYAPKKADYDTDDAALYVLCQPLSPAQLEAAARSQVLSETLPAKLGRNLPTGADAHEYHDQTQTHKGGASRRQTDDHGRFAPRCRSQRDERWLSPWSPTQRKSGLSTGGAARDERLQQAFTVRTLLPVLRAGGWKGRGLTVENVAHKIRPFHEAGWSAEDIVKAIDFRPDGTPWPHTGAQGILWLDRWLVKRLSAWTRQGEVLRSQSQREEDRGRELHAQRVAAQERRAREAAERATPRWNAQVAAGIALIRATLGHGC